MYFIGNKKVERYYVGRNAATALYMGAKKIWEAVRSCFGSGSWKGAAPWIGRDAWKY